MSESRPKLLVIAGPNGSGNWNSAETVLKAAQIATEGRENCLTNRVDLLFETVFSAADKIIFLERAQKAGYFIRLFFVGTDHPTINANRVAQRVLEGGHDVPIPKIIFRYAKSINNCALAATFGDRLYVHDNSADYAPARLLFRSASGTLGKVYGDVNPWAMPIFERLDATTSRGY